MYQYSIIIPARNEAGTIGALLQSLNNTHPGAEIIVVNDGSEDDTAQIASKSGARVLSLPYSMGNGAAVKAGAREATGDIFIFMDADGQHQAAEIGKLLKVMEEGYDMVIGARTIKAHASKAR